MAEQFNPLDPLGIVGAVKRDIDRIAGTFTNVIPYNRDLDIRNVESLPRGTGARYLIVIRGQGDELVAKQWARVFPSKLDKGDIVVDMKPAP